MSSIYQVREITRDIKRVLEGNFPFFWVQGEVANISRPSSGHIYFSLRDEEASLAAVWFKGNQQEEQNFDPLTGEVFEDGPEPSLAEKLVPGMQVLCAGRLTLYPPRGSYQLNVEIMQEAGRGRLQLEFEKLKVELTKKGYFEQSRKRSLPVLPRKIVVVTSPVGAAIHDFLRLASVRGLASEIRIMPALMQGVEAGGQIANQLQKANQEGWADVIVLIRGGGSLEDLWAFNTKEVAEAVFSSDLPVIAGVGHEVDFTLADMIADVRAATPSHAAQLLWRERREWMQMVDDLELRLQSSMVVQLEHSERSLDYLTRSLRLLSPAGVVEKASLRLALCEQRLGPVMHRLLARLEGRLVRAVLSLDGLDPKLPLRRGYALVEKQDGNFVRTTGATSVGEVLTLHLADGTVPVIVRE